jgi:outer membrane protein OmpA-like peptidoglycan-associated protein
VRKSTYLLSACLWLSSSLAVAADTDKDGIHNRADQCPQTPTAKAVNQQGCHFQHAGALFTVHFKPGSAWVSGEQTLAIRNAAKQLNEILRQFPGTQVAVRGFRGGSKDRSSADNLSLMRAKNVMRQLKLSRVPAEAMQVEGLGRAAVAGDEAAARRVDVLVLDWPPAQRKR